jgi:hypothetical protein
MNGEIVAVDPNGDYINLEQLLHSVSGLINTTVVAFIEYFISNEIMQTRFSKDKAL